MSEFRRGREGSRWVNVRPTGEEVAEWFKTVPLHNGMKHEHYVGGVTLIPGKEKGNEIVGYRSDGGPVIAERENYTFTPYVKIETRIAYFWKLCELREWVGVWEALPVVGSEVLGLPTGFFRYSATKPDGKTVNFVGCDVQVRMFEKGTVTFETVREGAHPFLQRRVIEGVPAAVAPPAQKVVPTATRWDVDPNAIHKAATGAVGRALGMAGMLIVPGSGVATAEDMLELGGPPPGAAPELPAQDVEAPMSDEQLRARAEELIGELEANDPAALTEFRQWTMGRKLILAEAQGPVLKGAVKKLERAVHG